MELIRAGQIRDFSNSGVTSRQLLFPENSASARLTITRVTIKPSALNPPHRHTASEHVWVALRSVERVDDVRYLFHIVQVLCLILGFLISWTAASRADDGWPWWLRVENNMNGTVTERRQPSRARCELEERLINQTYRRDQFVAECVQINPDTDNAEPDDEGF